MAQEGDEVRFEAHPVAARRRCATVPRSTAIDAAAGSSSPPAFIRGLGRSVRAAPGEGALRAVWVGGWAHAQEARLEEEEVAELVAIDPLQRG